MSVPLTLLGLLEREPSHGYDLKRDLHRMRELTDLKSRGDPLDVMLADHALYRLEADLRWIDHTAARLDLLRKSVCR